MMDTTLKLQIVTPEGIAFSDDVEMVTLPGSEGQLGVLPQHIPLMTQIVPGEIIIRKDGKERLFAVGEGLVEITGHQVAILTDMAVAAEDIDAAKVEEARQRAEERLREKLSNEEIANVHSALARLMAELNVKQDYRQ
jgi:F-type H+-transporting ATPase subunit epsilon